MQAKFKWLAGVALMVQLCACGGGGGGGGQTSAGGAAAPPQTPQTPVAVQSTLKLTVGGVNTAMSGIKVTVTLPAGVAVATNADGSVPAASVVPSGVLAPATAALAPGSLTYDPTQRRLSFWIYDTSVGGFGIGEFASASCLVTGTAPAPTEFTAQLQPYDLPGHALPTAGVSATFQLAQ